MEFLILVIPVIWLLISRYWLHNTISIVEMLFGMVIISSAAAVIYTYGIYSLTEDQEIWNGKITGKEKLKVSCGHSYDCHCSSSGGSSSCSTCYEHSYDVRWQINSTAGEIGIRRIDRQGLDTPPNWKKAYFGEPVSIIKKYTNYIQAAPSSLFSENKYLIDDRFKAIIPAYPMEFINEYSLNHALAVGVDVPDLQLWNDLLAEMLKELGPNKQINALVLFVNTDDSSYIHALEKAWLKGNKNDAVIVVGVTNYPDISWVDVMSWSPAELFKIQLRDDIKSSGKVNASILVPVIQKHIEQSYERMQMKDFSHLRDEIAPPEEVMMWLLIMVFLGPVIYTFLAHRYDTTAILRLPVSAGIFLIIAGLFVNYGVIVTVLVIASIIIILKAMVYFYEQIQQSRQIKDDVSKKSASNKNNTGR